MRELGHQAAGSSKKNDVRNGGPRVSVLEDRDETATELALGHADQLQPGAS